jgi:hypothetical protein
MRGGRGTDARHEHRIVFARAARVGSEHTARRGPHLGGQIAHHGDVQLLAARLQLADGQALVVDVDAEPDHHDVPVHPGLVDHLEVAQGRHEHLLLAGVL